MAQKKLHISLIFSNLVVSKLLNSNHRMRNFISNFAKIYDICKDFAKDLTDTRGNILRPGPKPMFSDVSVVALSLTAEAMGYDSENHLFNSLGKSSVSIPNLISRRQFNDRRKALTDFTETLRKRMAEVIDKDNSTFCVDSTPYRVCRNARAQRCKIGKKEGDPIVPNFGFCASQKMFYYGFKLHAVCGLSGVIHDFQISSASVHDINYLKVLPENIRDCELIGDRGYISRKLAVDLFENANIRLEVPYRCNQKDYRPTNAAFASARKRIETVYSQLDDQFLLVRNYAKQMMSIFARITAKISALTILQYLNFINNKPIGRVKTALI